MSKPIAKMIEKCSGKVYEILETPIGEIYARGGSLSGTVFLADNLEDFKDSRYCTSTSYEVKWLKTGGLVAFLERTG